MRLLGRKPVSYVVAALPAIVAVALVASVEPLPDGWLSRSNPHYWANVLRAGTFAFGGVILGMIGYTLVSAFAAERSVGGNHPRRKLYRHVTVISVSLGLLVATLLFYVRERIDDSLSPATPIALVGFIGTFIGLALMLSYQNSRLSSYHAAKQVIGVIAPDEGAHDLCIEVVGSTEQVSLKEWLGEFQGGVIARLSIEKIEEHPEALPRYGRWVRRKNSRAAV